MEESKLLFGKLLGEIYKLQNAMNPKGIQINEATIYRLVNGFEWEIDDQIENIGFVSRADEQAVADVLDEYFQDKAKLEALTGFYEVENKLKTKGIDRIKAIKIIKAMYAREAFTDVIKKFNSTGSPGEAKDFRLKDWDF